MLLLLIHSTIFVECLCVEHGSGILRLWLRRKLFKPLLSWSLRSGGAALGARDVGRRGQALWGELENGMWGRERSQF